MKALITIMTILLAIFLVCDPQAGVVTYNLDVGGTVVSDIPAESDGSILYNVDHLSAGLHSFKLQAVDEGGWPSDWSLPLDATKPNQPGGVRIIN